MAKNNTKNKPENYELAALPIKPEIEKAVLGSILLQPDVFFEVCVELRATDFHLDSNRRIFRAMTELAGTQRPIEPVTLISYLQDKKELEMVGGIGYVSGLIDGVSGRASLEEYLGILREVARRRQVILLCNSTITQAADPSESLSWVLSGVYEEILKVQGDARKRTGSFVREFSADVLSMLDEEMHSSSDLLGFSFGISNLDEATTGIRRGEFVVVGGFPGSGKTAFMLTIARKNAKRGVPTCIFSREMQKEQLLLRMWSSESEISYSKLRNPKNLHGTELRELRDTWGPMVASWPLMIDDEVVMIDDMIARAHLYRMKYKTQLFIVDYLQIIGARPEKEYERVSECCDKLTQFAKETGIPVVVGSQLTRPEKRDRSMNFEPNMMLLRSSGKIEQNAHLVLFTHHPEDDQQNPTGEDVIKIGKQRAGHKGREKAFFDVRLQRWEDRGEVHRAPEQTNLLVNQ